MDNEIFISYVQPNRDFAFQVHDAIQANKMKSWIAPSRYYGIEKGEYYGGEIVRAIKSCKAFVLIYSNYVNISPHIKREVYNAEDKKLIVIRLDNAPYNDDLSYLLKGVDCIEAFNYKMDDVVSLLLNRLMNITRSEKSVSTDKFLYNQGLKLFQSKAYQEAEKVLAQFVRIDPANLDARFYLALCMLQGKKPKKLDGLLVKAIEKILAPGISQHDASKILLAIIKYGYYTLNGFIQTSPTSEQLWNSLSGIDRLDGEIILDHLEDTENLVWQLLYKSIY